jgi:hypothetical protein
MEMLYCTVYCVICVKYLGVENESRPLVYVVCTRMTRHTVELYNHTQNTFISPRVMPNPVWTGLGWAGVCVWGGGALSKKQPN